VINWMLEVEDVEDVVCTVDDMKATDGRGRSEAGLDEDSAQMITISLSTSEPQ
jgi:hypothetical protein